MKLKDILHSTHELIENGYTIENNIIESINIICIGHFNNSCSLSISGKNIRLFGGYNNTKNIGFLLKSFIELFNLSEEDGIFVDSICNIPCRIVLHNNMCIGFGHFMEDKFVLREEFNTINE